MLICIAQSGYIYEINPGGATIWSKSVSGMLTHAYRYTACYVNGSNINVQAETSENEVCTGTTIQLNASATGGTNYTYLLDIKSPGVYINPAKSNGYSNRNNHLYGFRVE